MPSRTGALRLHFALSLLALSVEGSMRPILVAMVLAGAVSGAEAAERLAVGAVAPIFDPPGYRVVAVYQAPRGPRWEPADTSMRYSFREPLYTTTPGFRYYYVRGYTLRRVALASEGKPRAVKRAAKPDAPSARRKHSCVTDIGYGRYDDCS
jgi:hypothetical protein